MPARKANELTDLIKKLRTIRKQHEVALAEIETTFKSFGIEHLLDGGSRKRGPAAGATAAKKGKAKAAPKAAKKGPGKRRGPKPKAAAATTPAAKPGKRGPKPKAPSAKAGRKGKAAPKAAGKKTRAKYTQTGDEFIVSFVAKKGGATTNEIRQHWTKQGRKGKAENNLTGLVKSGKLLRSPTPGAAGSTYSVPGGSTPPSSSATN